MAEFFTHALSLVASPSVLLLIFIGVLFGIIGGSIPGFTVTMAILVVFPFTFAMDPVSGVSIMVGVFVGGYSGGLVSGVMLGIPGTPSSITTVYDGYPMALKGEPGRALGVGVLASFIGTVISVAVLVLFGPLLAKFSMNFRPWEISTLILFALTLVAGLSNGRLLKGMLAAALGLFITTVGYDRNSNIRFDFDSTLLSSGFEILPVMIGIFAFSQLMENIEKTNNGNSTKENEIPVSVSIPYRTIVKDIFSHKVNTVRSSLIGSFVGALPGTGGTVANFISYDQAKKFSSQPQKFGTGVPAGIIASEASNSAVAGGAFVPTLALGIPGDLPMAIMMGVLILHGITPGPLMFEQNPVLVGAVYVSLLMAAVAMVLCQLLLVRWFARIALIPQQILVPIVLMLCAIGAYALNNNLFDIWVLFGFGIFGYLLWKADVPLAPLILGVVLGQNLEQQLFRALELDSNLLTFLTRPLSALFIALSIASIVLSIMQNKKMKSQSSDSKAT
ncbi:tripartite tricarboxylate transporter permease [Halomonas sp. DN3]|uniref:tripartite tricarboxylate transporter permease n=1 Tax=Halomonas sp. DN3 TaxID=2953657 RepID=UPI00209F3618|nr:tripartite tricarboxylate transporter permease [Halomonas sp. DN3]USZ49854.1 tripartite tricarboxylate transporter permease [Halomonas sp. DN3]